MPKELRSLNLKERTEYLQFAKEKKGQRRNYWAEVRLKLIRDGSVAFPKDWLSPKQQRSSSAISSFVSNNLKKGELKGVDIAYGFTEEGEFFAIIKNENQKS